MLYAKVLDLIMSLSFSFYDCLRVYTMREIDESMFGIIVIIIALNRNTGKKFSISLSKEYL